MLQKPEGQKMGVMVMKEEGQNSKVGLAVFRGTDSGAVSSSFLQIREGSSRPQ